MSRVVIIGGSGHVGTYLVPRLVEAGHEVINVSRGQRKAYTPNAAWGRVRTVTADREAEEKAGTFGARIAALEGEIVIDMICFTLPSAKHIVEALRGRVQHFLHCGTIWVYGHNATVPATEDQPLNPFGDYGTGKAQIEAYLLDEARRTGFPATVFRPGHIVGRAGTRSIRPGTSTVQSSARSRAARNCRSPISGWRRCITSMPTTWRRW
jgi:nucleoside-diphosphate-sugar epimerase